MPLMQARHISWASRAIMAFARLFSHEIMAANDWKTPGSRSLQILSFLSQYSFYFSRLNKFGEEGPAHGLCFYVFLSSPGKMFVICKVCESEFSIKRFVCTDPASLSAEHNPTPHPLR